MSNTEAERAAYTAGLRALADILDANPDLPLPYDGDGKPLSFIEGIAAESRRGAAVFARVMPGPVEKSGTDSQFYLKAKLHGLRVKWIATREEMCERIVVGTREVEIEEPDPEAVAALPKVKRVEVVEDVEWKCRPVLAGEVAS
ncbi:hypothetical protein ACFWYW_28440 [Nonomuraea sp. NPDC059023]|uniref:hypothetical protein n=1 Tax=unclassified Nonomuraea TaxID=2593643 RepID=UPI00367E2E2A